MDEGVPGDIGVPPGEAGGASVRPDMTRSLSFTVIVTCEIEEYTLKMKMKMKMNKEEEMKMKMRRMLFLTVRRTDSLGKIVHPSISLGFASSSKDPRSVFVDVNLSVDVFGDTSCDDASMKHAHRKREKRAKLTSSKPRS